MTTETTVVTTGWTEDQIKVIAMYQEKLGMTRSNAVRKMRGEELRGKKAADLLAAAVGRPAPKVAEPKPAKAKAPKATKPKTERKSAYDKDKVIALYMEQGLRVKDIAKKLAPISAVYVSRILFGNENSGGISPEQAKRRKEQAARFKASAEASDKE